MDLFDIAVARKLSGGGGGGDSDFSTAQMTVTGNTPIWAPIPFVDPWGDSCLLSSDSTNMTLDVGIYTVPLYKGVLVVYASHLMGASVEGNAEMEDGILYIFGDFSIGYK